MKKYLAWGLVIVVAIVVIVWGVRGNKPAQVSQELPKFRITSVTWVGYAPFWLAEDKGFFKNEGVDVTITNTEDPAQYRAALRSGSVEGLGDTLDSSVLARSLGVPAVMVGQVDFSNGADGIAAIDAIKTVQDLKGKTIAVQRNFVSEAWLNYLLFKNGMQPSDVTLVDTEAGAAGAAFAAGKVDVAVTYEPWLSKAKTRAGGHILVSSHDIPGVVVDVLSVREDYLKAHPEVVAKVLRGFSRAVEYWQANPTEANELMSKHYNVSPAEFADMVSGLKWPTLAEATAYFGTPAAPGKVYEVANTFADIFIKTGQIQGAKPNVAEAIDGSVLKSILK